MDVEFVLYAVYKRYTNIVNTTITTQTDKMIENDSTNTNRLLQDNQLTRDSNYYNALGIAQTVFDTSKLITANVVSAIDRVNNTLLDLPGILFCS